MQRIDRGVGIALTLLALAVLASARAFPDVPGQKLGAGFLPMLVGAGLLLCGLGLVLRSRRAGPAATPRAAEQLAPALAVVAGIVVYVLAADRFGFLLVAPLVLLGVFKAFGVRWRLALPWALAGTLVVHLVFYKLLRVPLPWGLLRPLY